MWQLKRSSETVKVILESTSDGWSDESQIKQMNEEIKIISLVDEVALFALNKDVEKNPALIRLVDLDKFSIEFNLNMF